MAVLDERETQQLADLAERGRLRLSVPPVEERREIRVRAGVSIDELAAALGFHRDTIYGYERGSRSPDPGFAERYAAALELLRRNSAPLGHPRNDDDRASTRSRVPASADDGGLSDSA